MIRSFTGGMIVQTNRMKTSEVKMENKLLEIKPGTIELMAIMISALTITQELPQDDFEWRDRMGDMHKPKNMSSKHIFYTWLMIWNHSAPSSFRIPWGYRYTFDQSLYPNDYMERAFHVLYNHMKKHSYGPKITEAIKTIEGYISCRPDLEQIKIH